MSKNNITGDKIKSKLGTKEQQEAYAGSWERVFGKKDKNDPQDHISWLDTKYNTGCNHQWIYDGHGHNYDVYKCAHCKILGEY